MENGEKILSLLEKMYIDVNGRLLDVDKRLLNLETGLSEVKTELGSVKAIVIKIEHDHGQKLGALFDGHKLISDKLDRVEAQVSKHEEIIFRRIK